MNALRLDVNRSLSAEFEVAFRKDYVRRNRVSQRFGLLGLLLIILIFGSLDISAPPASYRIGLIGLYGFICPLLLSLYRFTYLPAFKRWSQHAMVFAVWAIAGELWVMEYLVPTDKGSDASPTTVGLIVFVMVAATLLRLRTVYLTVCCAGCWIVHTALSYTVLHLPYPLWNVSVLFTVCIIGILAARIMENYARTEFRLRQTLLQKRAKLAAQNRQLGRLAAQRAEDMQHIHHDVGNRVISAKASLECAIDGADKGIDHSQLEHDLLTAHEEVGSINRLFAVMLYRAQVEAEQQPEPTRREPVDLPVWINRLIDGKRKAIEARKRLAELRDEDPPPDFDFQFEAHSNGPQCLVDTIALELILTNLLDNAVKYSPNGGKITVELWDLAEMLCIRISDEGDGIAPQDQRRIFDLRNRGSQAVGTITGKGIGLHHVRRLLLEQGGSITVESKGVPGKGSIFTLTLPEPSHTGTSHPCYEACGRNS